MRPSGVALFIFAVIMAVVVPAMLVAMLSSRCSPERQRHREYRSCLDAGHDRKACAPLLRRPGTTEEEGSEP